MNTKNRDDLIKYIDMALSSNEYLSYAEIVNYIENHLNVSLDCYNFPISAVKKCNFRLWNIQRWCKIETI